MQKISLNGQWQAVCYTTDGQVDFTYEGTVPGCVHTDLIGTKLPADIFYRDNTESCQWIEQRDFAYTKTFSLSQIPQNARLVFDGLDVYTDIYLNGVHLGTTDNMFISHSFPVSHALKEGENALCVRFYSPIKRVEGLPECTGAFTRERMHTRRVQCTYGWDWVARFVTCGIWRDVSLQWDSGFRVKDAYVYTDSLAENTASVVVETEFEEYEQGGYVDITMLSPTGQTVYDHRFYVKEPSLKTYIDIPNAQLWYPVGYGAQPLYKLIVGQKEIVFGIRTAKVFEIPDAAGSPYYERCLELKKSVSAQKYDRNEEFSGFQLRVNGVPIRCKGANWVPPEPFPSAVTDEKVTELLLLAREANVNMLRVWGGGIFESQHFYSECDRLGILVTQDFLMACGHYPENEPEFLAHMRKEAEFAARSLRNHPALMWWSGDNENAVMGFDEAQDYRGRTAIHQGIGPVLERLDPQRRFFLSSPYGGTPYASKTKGTTHNTQYMGCSLFPYIRKTDMRDYKEHLGEYLARFIAEEPSMGAVCLPSLRRFMTDGDIFDSDEMWNYHTKGNPALKFTLFEILANFAEKVLGGFTDGHDRYFKLKYAQYEWVRVTLENMRRNAGFCTGIIYWMWNDCWPAASGWSFVDYYCLPKASFYSFKRCAGNVIASIDRKDAYEIYLCNDSLADKTVTMTLSYLLEGRIHLLRTGEATAAASSAKQVWTVPLTAIPEGAVLLCDISGEGFRDRAFYKDGDLAIQPCDGVRKLSGSGDSVTVTADRYVHAVELEGAYVFEDNYFSLMPGESRTVRMRPVAGAAEITVRGYTWKN